MMRVLSFVLTFSLVGQSAMAYQVPSLRRLNTRIHTQAQLDQDTFLKIVVGMVRTSTSPRYFYQNFVKKTFAKDKKSLVAAQRYLKQINKMPAVKVGGSWLEFEYQKQRIRVDIVNFQNLQFKINGHSWVFDKSSPLWMQLQTLERKFQTKSAWWHGLFIDDADAVAVSAVVTVIIGLIIGAGATVMSNATVSKEGAAQFSAGFFSKELETSDATALACFTERSWDSADYETCRTGGRLRAHLNQVEGPKLLSFERHCASQTYPITDLQLTFENEGGVTPLYVVVYYPPGSNGDDKVMPRAMEIYQLKDGKLAPEGKISIVFDRESNERDVPIIRTAYQITYNEDVPFEDFKIQERSMEEYNARWSRLDRQLNGRVANDSTFRRKTLYHRRASMPDGADLELRKIQDRILDRLTAFTDYCQTRHDYDIDVPANLTEITQKARDLKENEQTSEAAK